jgi:hypothetical protein
VIRVIHAAAGVQIDRPGRSGRFPQVRFLAGPSHLGNGFADGVAETATDGDVWLATLE